jgi:hypothetical protein
MSPARLPAGGIHRSEFSSFAPKAVNRGRWIEVAFGLSANKTTRIAGQTVKFLAQHHRTPPTFGLNSD